MLIEDESQKDPFAVSPDLLHDVRHKRSSSRWNEEFSPASSTVAESIQAGELISRAKLTAFSEGVQILGWDQSEVWFYILKASSNY
ncbi:hypothetical protein Fmac_028368 [Flemingia macrophylla]|uniref:Uncharacterized protein n=1 Tax=Flemingia macrophylla TaxID=520843 RepID=A0ABD1L7A5_9FABA